jgi:hypothetical protein
MYVVVRSYSGESGTAVVDAVVQSKDEVKELLSGVPGFVSYAAFRHDGGATTVTMCQDKEGTDESTRRAAAWVTDNIDATIDPPSITEGETAVSF